MPRRGKRKDRTGVPMALSRAVPVSVSRAAPRLATFTVPISGLRRYQLLIYFGACLTFTWPLQLLLARAGAHSDLGAGPSVLWPLAVLLFPDMPLADYPFFFAQVVAASIIITWLYNSTGGRLCITLVAHLMLNLNVVLYLPSPATGLRPIACAALVAGAAAGLVILPSGHPPPGFGGPFSALRRPTAPPCPLSLQHPPPAPYPFGAAR